MPLLGGALASVLPYLVGLIVVAGGLLAAYLGIKGKGKAEEKAKWEKAQAEALANSAAKVEAAQAENVKVTQATDAEVAQIKHEAEVKREEANKPSTDYKPGDKFNF